MKRLLMLAAAMFAVGQVAVVADAQSSAPKAKTKVAKVKTKKKPAKPKNEITKLEKARAEDHTTRQVTPDPKKSPGEHADNLSKNINRELNRESKDINHFFQGKKKKK